MLMPMKQRWKVLGLHLEEGFAAEELSENAADGPDIDLGELLVLDIERVSIIGPRTY